jgi:hypothetical protein
VVTSLFSWDFCIELIHCAGCQSGEIGTNGESEAEVAKTKSKIASKVEKLRIRACALMNTRESPGLQVCRLSHIHLQLFEFLPYGVCHQKPDYHECGCECRSWRP